jgi:hypothetical protein
MGEYCISVGSVAVFVASETIYVELVPAASTEICLTKINVVDVAAPSDVNVRLRVRRETTAGTGGTTGTIVEMNPGSGAATTTCKIANGTAAFTLGTTTDLLLDMTAMGRGNIEWIARDKDDVIWSNPGERLAITITSAVSSARIESLNCYFKE